MYTIENCGPPIMCFLLLRLVINFLVTRPTTARLSSLSSGRGFSPALWRKKGKRSDWTLRGEPQPIAAVKANSLFHPGYKASLKSKFFDAAGPGAND